METPKLKVSCYDEIFSEFFFIYLKSYKNVNLYSFLYQFPFVYSNIHRPMIRKVFISYIASSEKLLLSLSVESLLYYFHTTSLSFFITVRVYYIFAAFFLI